MRVIVLDTRESATYFAAVCRGNPADQSKSTTATWAVPKHMGSTTFDDIDPTAAGSESSRHTNGARGAIGCAVASDRT
jgi:hypothetical protein